MENSLAILFNRFTDIRMLQPFHHRNFSLLFLTTITMSLGNFMMMISLGWLVLEITDSPLSLGIVWATRTAPRLILGILAGAVADKFDRKKMLIISFILCSVCGFALGFLIMQDWIQLWHVLIITLIWGSIHTFDMPARQAFVVDIVGREGAMGGISITAVGMRAIGILGGAAAGFIIHFFGIEWPFFFMAGTYILAIGIILFIRRVEQQASAKKQTLWYNIIEGIQIIMKNRIILALMVMAATCEMFGFSYSVLLPVFARDILDVGSIGLGMFSTARSVGGLVAGLLLASLGDFKYKGRLMLGVFFFFGVSLIFFAQSSYYPISLILIGIVGVTAAGHDALQHILLQLNVNEDQRGRAMGIWQLSIGFGLIGSTTIGIIAEAFGAPIAQSVFGTAMIIIFIILVLIVPKLTEI
jgi:MFS family permease